MTKYDVMKSASIENMALYMAALVAGALGGVEQEELNQIKQEMLAFLQSEAPQ